MATLQYDTPTTGAAFTDAITNNPAISAATAAAITTLLGLTDDSSVNVGLFDGTTVSAPAGGIDVLSVTPPGAAGEKVNLVLPADVADANVIIINSAADVTLSVDHPAAVVAAEARIAVATDDVIVAGGTGNDTLTVTGGANVTLDGGLGDDVLITGSGNDTVTGGAGDDHIETGAGNDTIITGVGHDVVLAGAGHDVIQVAGGVADFDVSVKGSFLELGGVTNSVTIQGGEFVSFEDGSTIAIAQTEAEASALRLYEGLLGRDADVGGAELFTNEIDKGTSLTTITESFLASTEYKDSVNDGFVQDLYLSLLDRSADQGEQAFWLNQLSSGKTQADVAGEIAVSTEAQTVGQSNDSYIESLYSSALGRPAEAGAVDHWVGQLIAGSNRAEVADQIFGSAEASHHANVEFVESLYTNALGRPVGDVDTYKAEWVASLDQGTSQADVAIGIVGSPEAVDHITNVVVVHGAV